MKQILFLLSTTTLLTACGQNVSSTDKKLIGIWTGTTKESKDRAESPPGSMGSKVLKNLMIIEFRENHDVVYPNFPPEYSKDLKYEVNEDKLRIGVGCYAVEKITDTELTLLELDRNCKDNPLAFRLAFKRTVK